MIDLLKNGVNFHEFLENASHESLNLSDREKASEEDVCVEESQACLDRAATPLRLSNGAPCSKPYCPQVSDISLPDTPPSVAPVVPNVKVSDTPVRVKWLYFMALEML